MEINEKLLRQIIEGVLAEMQTSDKSVHFVHLSLQLSLQCQIPEIF